MTKFKTVWFWGENRQATDTHNYVMAFYDDSHKKPSLVTNEKSPNHIYCHSFASTDEDGRYLVKFVEESTVSIVDLWYVYIDAETSVPHMRSVMAFANDRFPDGTVVNFSEVEQLGISPHDSCGFIRWFASDSRVQQIFVKENHRRKRISTKLFGVADMVIVGDRNWNGSFLNGGDVTTNDGEKLRGAWHNSKRVTPRIGSVC